MPDAIDGYETGPNATQRAFVAARARLGEARAAIVVEGVSDQIAVETAAGRLGVDLAAERVVVVPIGGAHAIGRVLADAVVDAPGLEQIAGLFDVREETYVRGAIESAMAVPPYELFVCVDDLEDELCRSAGRTLIERLVEQQGDATALATMRAQPHWRDRPFDHQFHRFVAAGARRKMRYAASITGALPIERIPAPLLGAVAHVSRRRRVV